MKLFTGDAHLIKAVPELKPLLAISVFSNGIQPILSGVAIGSGWQTVDGYLNLVTYYISLVFQLDVFYASRPAQEL